MTNWDAEFSKMKRDHADWQKTIQEKTIREKDESHKNMQLLYTTIRTVLAPKGFDLATHTHPPLEHSYLVVRLRNNPVASIMWDFRSDKYICCPDSLRLSDSESPGSALDFEGAVRYVLQRAAKSI